MSDDCCFPGTWNGDGLAFRYCLVPVRGLYPNQVFDAFYLIGCYLCHGLQLIDAGFDRSKRLRLKAFLCGSVHHFILFDSNMDWSPVQANGLSLLGELYAVQNRCDESNIVKEGCFVMHELLYVNQ